MIFRKKYIVDQEIIAGKTLARNFRLPVCNLFVETNRNLPSDFNNRPKFAVSFFLIIINRIFPPDFFGFFGLSREIKIF